MDSNKFIILAGPSSVGKTVIAQKLLQLDDSLEKVITTTTREPRPNEQDGRDYYYVTDEEFASLIQSGSLFEYEIFNNHWYGTTHTEVERINHSGKHPIWIIDPKGALKIDKLYPNTVTIFIRPESLDQLRHRLKLRNFTEEEINNRLAIAQEELAKIDLFDFSVVNQEGQLEETARQILSIIHGS